MLSAWLGRPPSVHEQDIDAEYPERNDIDECGRWQDRLSLLKDNTVRFDGEMRLVTYLRGMVTLLTALDNVLCRLYTVRRRRNYKEEQDIAIMEEINEELEKWHANLPACATWERGRQVLPHFLVLHLWHA